eukprot:GILK01015101.1.p1 GENE.GILK01015101.1~~GILK01015101.1.p1  ORF type:complete len:114 (-),score=26.87 GILK01015101.1:226-567(-)
MEDDTDIYGGLDETLHKLDAGQQAIEMKAKDDELEVTKKKLADTEQELKKVSDLKNVLMKNISCLYKTAKMEIQRKDEQIAQLRAQLQAQQDRSRPPAGSTENPSSTTSNTRR